MDPQSSAELSVQDMGNDGVGMPQVPVAGCVDVFLVQSLGDGQRWIL